MLPNKRLKLTARVDCRLRNESFFSAPQLKRDPLGGCTMASSMTLVTVIAALAASPVRAPCAQADSPRAALGTYLKGIRTGDRDLVLSVYYFGDRPKDFYLPGPLPLGEYRVTNETVLDSLAAKRWNDKGIAPSAMPGDVELEVEELMAGRREMFSYSLRRIEGKWRIYAHSAWDAPE